MRLEEGRSNDKSRKSLYWPKGRDVLWREERVKDHLSLRGIKQPSLIDNFIIKGSYSTAYRGPSLP